MILRFFYKQSYFIFKELLSLVRANNRKRGILYSIFPQYTGETFDITLCYLIGIRSFYIGTTCWRN